MRTVNALFVGIDDYPGKPLRGCVNDVTQAESWLRGQPGLAPRVLSLHDARATRARVVEGIETHLGRSGPGDTALLWFSGHGSARDTDDPRAATGRSESLVCHDSLREGGQPLLRDTELGALLDRIARGGAHVVAVLDCCHAGGATREDAVPGARTRGVAWQPWWGKEASGGAGGGGAWRPGRLWGGGGLWGAGGVARERGARGGRGTRDGGGSGGEAARHVLLAACRPRENAYETPVDGAVHGCFSHALLGALRRLDATATYGALHALVEERVRGAHRDQHPELRGPESHRFLYDDPLPAAPFLLRHTESGWEVNCGSAHGLRAAGAEFTLLGTGAGAPGRPPRVVAVRAVRAASALVEPVGWRPEPFERDVVFGVTPSASAFPPASVTVSGPPDAVRAVSAALDGQPLLARGGDGLPLRVAVGDDGLARVSGGAGHPLEPLPLRSGEDAARVADCLAHVARWHQLRDFGSPDPAVSARLRITVEPLVGDVRVDSGTGELVCAYTADGREPQVRVRIHNDWHRELWCVLLDLTDSYAVSPALYEGDFVGAGRVGLARRGEAVWLRLPSGRAVVRGAVTRDVLKVVATEGALNTAPFVLPAWSPGAAGALPRGGVVRLAPVPRGGSRDVGAVGRGVGRWGTASVTIRTEVR